MLLLVVVVYHHGVAHRSSPLSHTATLRQLALLAPYLFLRSDYSLGWIRVVVVSVVVLIQVVSMGKLKRGNPSPVLHETKW